MRLLEGQEKSEHVESLARDARGDSRDSWRRHYASKYEYIDLGYGVVRWMKPSIKSEFWYDDEQESPLTDDPEQRKCYFMAANMDRLNDYGIARWDEDNKALDGGRCCIGTHLAKPFVAKWPSGECYPVFYGHEEDIELYERQGMERRPMTDEEVGELREIMDGQRAKFEKRLKTYWKRCSDKVWACGYWANR